MLIAAVMIKNDFFFHMVKECSGILVKLSVYCIYLQTKASKMKQPTVTTKSPSVNMAKIFKGMEFLYNFIVKRKHFLVYIQCTKCKSTSYAALIPCPYHHSTLFLCCNYSQ